MRTKNAIIGVGIIILSLFLYDFLPEKAFGFDWKWIVTFWTGMMYYLIVTKLK